MATTLPIPISDSFITDDGLRIVFDRWEPTSQSTRVPVVLHHGFAADAHSNWVAPGIVGALVDAGRTVIALDARGHGRSDKPHDPSRYGHIRMSLDLSQLLTYQSSPLVDLVGYSMGGYVVAIAAARREPRLRSLVIGGIGASAIADGVNNRSSIADALEVDDPKSITSRSARQFRRFADATRADRSALAAIMRGPFDPVSEAHLIDIPTLVLVGEADDLAKNPEALSSQIPAATLTITAGDHLSALNEPAYRQHIVSFLSQPS